MSEPDPIAQRSERWVRWFTRYLRWHMARHFHAVRVSRAGLPRVPAGRPLIVYSNHPSWWDPALYYVVGGKLLPGRPGYGPMEATALHRYAILQRLGVFGLEPTPHGAARFLALADRIMARPDAMLLITAEGAFADARRRPIVLRPGIAHLARRHPHCVLVPLALEYSFWNESRPEALARFGPAIGGDPGPSVAEWNARLGDALERTMDALAEESQSRDPARFTIVLRGSAGVGGPYDLWRRLRAAARGRTFHPEHEATAHDA